MVDNIKVGQTIYNWLSNFATVYRGTLPSGIEPDTNYILYKAYVDDVATPFIQPITIYAQKTTSYSNVLLIANDIENAIGQGGVLISSEDGTMKIKIDKGNPFYQDKDDEDRTTKAGYINLLITIY